MFKNELGIDEGRYLRRPRWLSAIPCAILNENAKAVWYYLADNVNDERGGIAFPSNEGISFNLGLSVDSVKSALERLSALELVTWRRTGGSNTFTVNAPRKLIDADLRIVEIEASKPKGELHDYVAYSRMFDRACEQWLSTLKARPEKRTMPGARARKKPSASKATGPKLAA